MSKNYYRSNLFKIIPSIMSVIVSIWNIQTFLSFEDPEIFGVKGFLTFEMDPCNTLVALCGKTPDSHIMCNELKTRNSKCKDFEMITMDDDYKIRILAAHNGLRNLEAERVKFEIANMNRLFWDYTLYKMARQYIYRCPMDGPDTCHFIGDFLHPIDQNYYYSSDFYGYKTWLEVAIHSWHNYSASDSGLVNLCHGAGFCPAALFLWPTTQYVGCAAARVFGGLLFVCYYGPKQEPEKELGSVIKYGDICSKCPMGWSCSNVFQALCDNYDNFGLVNKYPNLFCYFLCLITVILYN